MKTLRNSNILDDLHLRLFSVVYMELSPFHWNSRDVRDSFWRFYVNDRDGASVLLADGSLPLRANKMYFIPEGVFFSCNNTEKVGHFYIHFDVLGVPRPILQTMFAAPVEISDAAALKNEVDTIANAVSQGKELDISLQCRAKSLLFGALAQVFANRQSEDVAEYWNLSVRHEPVAPALKYIEENVGERLDNQSLARCCHWSEDHFARRFRQCLGLSPAKYVQERRIAIASQQLLFTTNSIDHIATDTGFADRFHFSRVFAKIKNCTPAAYRKTARV
jgi:AraC-like DNA-binding protein